MFDGKLGSGEGLSSVEGISTGHRISWDSCGKIMTGQNLIFRTFTFIILQKVNADEVINTGGP